MLKDVLYKASLLMAVCLGCAACSQEDDAVNGAGGSGGVRILFRVADASATRATEDGWDEGWNENTIKRLDIFWFAANGELKDHLLPSNLPSFTSQNTDFQEVEVNGLTYNDLANNPDDVYYMVANCPQLDGLESITLPRLQAMMIQPGLKVDARQQLFVMDARTARDSTKLYELDTNAKNATLRFQLYRAAAKVRLAVKDKDGNDILSDCRYRFVNHVSDGTSVLAESELYGKGEGQSLRSTDDFQPFTLTKDGKAVLYTYPNDWFDESLLAADGTFADRVIYTKDDLIDEEKQTYIMLKAPYTDGNTYYYKVPVNFTMADNSDKDGFTAAEIETLRNGYYRINRNCLYDITVTIDRAGGPLTEPVTPRFHIRVNDWQKGGDYKIGQGEFE